MRSTKFVKTAQNDWHDIGRPLSCNAFAIARLSSCDIIRTCWPTLWGTWASSVQHAVYRAAILCSCVVAEWYSNIWNMELLTVCTIIQNCVRHSWSVIKTNCVLVMSKLFRVYASIVMLMILRLHVITSLWRLSTELAVAVYVSCYVMCICLFDVSPCSPCVHCVRAVPRGRPVRVYTVSVQSHVDVQSVCTRV